MNPNPPLSTELPSRFRYENIRKYDHVLREATEKYPKVVFFDPRPEALATFAARVRDAKISIKEHQWPGLTLDLDKFNKICDDLVVAERNVDGKGVVAIGSKDLLRASDLAKQITPPRIGQLVVHFASDSVLRALCVLCQARILPEEQLPIKILGNYDPAVIAQCELLHDVAFDKQVDGYTLI